MQILQKMLCGFREFGAEGIGLCLTEHMFMGHDRLPVVQKMI